MQELNYCIYGYDKDGGVHELICACPTMIQACSVASMLIHAMASGCRKMRRSDTGEPFDWLVVTRSHDPYNQHKIFSDAYPDGFRPPF